MSSFYSITLENVQGKIRVSKFLKEMDLAMPWNRLCSLIELHYPKAGMGRRPMPLKRMLKIYCLQQWYQLSDPGAEEAIYDRMCCADLMHGEEKAYFGDKGYFSDVDKRAARDAGIYWGILDRAKRNDPLSSKQKKRNQMLSKVRSKVEHAFAVLKERFGYRKVRYKGLYKNSCQLNMLFALGNIYKMRRQLTFSIA